MSKVNPQVASSILLSVTQSVGIFTALLPPFRDVRKADPQDAGIREDVRMGEVAAGSLVVGIGLIAGMMIDNPAPVIASVAMAGVLIVMYETTLARPGTAHDRK